MATNAYYTYNTLVTPGHADIELILTCICQVVQDTSRIKVHAQSINVTDITVQEAMYISYNEPNLADDANLLRTTVLGKDEAPNLHL
jgi:predicted metal-binding protein